MWRRDEATEAMSDTPKRNFALESLPIVENGYALVAPGGRRILVAKEIFETFEKFRISKSTGTILIDFKSGGVASIRATETYNIKQR